jgi:hypothetical protein
MPKSCPTAVAAPPHPMMNTAENPRTNKNSVKKGVQPQIHIRHITIRLCGFQKEFPVRKDFRTYSS